MGLFLTVELGRSLKRLRVGSSCLHGRGDMEGLVWILQGAPERLQLLWGLAWDPAALLGGGHWRWATGGAT